MKNISTLILEVLSTLTEILTKVLYPYIYQSIIYYFAESISPFITPVNWLSIVSLIRPNIRNVSISIRDWFYDSDTSWFGLSEECPTPIGDFLSEELGDTKE